jgi:hypothetical protein
MVGGLLKSASRVALVAAAGLVAGGVGANAADFGGNCCADLEERVAELEGTAARKGNRKVSLTISGQVNEAVLFWDDGFESNAYVVTNENSRTRFRFVGDAKVSADWSAGFLLEIGVRIANSGGTQVTPGVNQLVDDNTSSTGSLDLRHSAWYLDSKTFGRLWVGHTSMATDGITEINLSNGGVNAGNDVNNWNGGFFLRSSEGQLLAFPNGDDDKIEGLTWFSILSQAGANVGDGDRRNVVKYVTPTLAGFSIATSWGEDDVWDAALRYAGEFNGVRIAAGIGYQRWTDGNRFGRLDGDLVDTGSQGDRGCADLSTVEGAGGGSDVDCYAVGLSGSIMHVPTGLYVAASYGFLQDDNRRRLFAAEEEDFDNAKDRDEHWYVQAGIEKKFFALGKTTIYGEYFRGDTGAGLKFGEPRDLDPDDATFIASSTVDVWGFGLVQSIDAAAMDLYIGYRNYSADVSVIEVPEAGDANRRKLSLEDFQAVMAGGIIRF